MPDEKPTTGGQPIDLPTEYGIAAGIALALSNQFIIAVGTGIVWLVLRRIKRTVPAPLMFVISITIAGFLFLTAGVVIYGLTPMMLVMPFAAAVVALLLFFTESNTWAYVLVVWYLDLAVGKILAAISFYTARAPGNVFDLGDVSQRTLLSSIVVHLITIWVAANYLWKTKSKVSQEGNAGKIDQTAL